MKQNDKFFIGLDIGTDSVGWAATDENYALLRLKGKTTWGAHIFSEAESAEGRRGFRCAGRRLERRKRRISLLNELFKPLLNEYDETFLLRLAESAYLKEDKKHDKSVHALFKDKKIEREFHEKYPTIWHLRKAMCAGEKEAFGDVRFIYLAIHHIIKYRGNFLLSGTVDPSKFDYTIFGGLNNYFKELLSTKTDGLEDDSDFEFINKDNQKALVKLLIDKDKNKTDKKKEMKNLFSPNSEIDIFIQLFSTLVVGGEFTISKLGDEFSDFEKAKITLTNFDEKEEEYREMLGEQFDIVEYAKIIYDYVLLHDIIGNSGSLSYAFANMYDSHRMQLKALKKIVRLIDEKEGKTKTKDSLFYKIFYKKDEKHNYAQFVGHNSALKKKDTSTHDFNKFILDTIKDHEEVLSGNKDWRDLKFLAEKDMLCETISYKSTSVIPHQLHEFELIKILNNAKVHFPYISTIEEKIVKLFKFRVPYYCGPLNTRSPYSNVVKKDGKESESVFPWNFEDIIDTEKTKEKFMNGLTNECTYLRGKNVLPKQSIVYQDFIIFNRLNSLMINGIKCDQKTKSDLFVNLISKNKKTSVNRLKKYLLQKYEHYSKNGVSISGINENDDFDAESRASFSKFFDLEDYREFKKVERIIYLLTIYCDNHEDAESVIFKEFKDLSEQQKKFIKGFKSKGWGNLSHELLRELKWCDENAVCLSIYDILKETTETFMQIINDSKYSFGKLINEENKKSFADLSNEDRVEEIIDKTPPKMRRSVISAVKIVDELIKIKKEEPSSIAIEVTRTSDKKKKGKDGNELSRAKELKRMIDSLKKDSDRSFVDAKELENEFNNALSEKISLRGKHIYLYFKQLGIDVYTGKKIKLEDVLDSTKYDIDHIIPRRLIKDDSLDNLVLVSREQNQGIKGGGYPLPLSIRNNPEVQKIWKFLHKHKNFSDKKYNNLIRATEITDEELNTFINAQINVVNQSNKVIRDVLSIKYPGIKLIFSKAQYPSLLRQVLEIPKLRDLNDTHHALDAYLNVVSGTLLNKRFGNLELLKKRSTMSEEEQRSTFNLEGYLTGKVLHKENGRTELGNEIFNNSQRHDFLLTYRKTYQDSEFYKATIGAVGENGSPIPVHTNKDNPLSKTEVYGSYQGLIPEYHLVATIETTKKKQSKLSKRFVQVPHLMVELCKRDEKKLRGEIIESLDLADNEKLIDLNTKMKIYNNQKVEVSGIHYLFFNANAAQINFKPTSPIFLDNDANIYLAKALKRIESDKNLENFDGDSYEFSTDKDSKNKFVLSKKKNLEILAKLTSFSSNKKYDFCPMIIQLRNNEELEAQKIFSDRNISEQIKFLKSCISLFGRKSDSLAGASCRKSKRSVLNEVDIYLINYSITGLFTNKTKL